MIAGTYIVVVDNASRTNPPMSGYWLKMCLRMKCLKCEKKAETFVHIKECTRLVVKCDNCEAKPYGFSILELLHRHLKDISNMKQKTLSPGAVKKHLVRWDDIFNHLPGYERLYT